MIKTERAVLVEGRYDKIKLENFIDAPIITTDGFAIFNDRARMDMIRRIAVKKGLIILTDSDSAGFLIRSRIAGSLPADKVTHVYVPEIAGKEKRKTGASAEGLIGVEGMDEKVIKEAFAKAGIGVEQSEKRRRAITNTDLYEYGFSGRADSRAKRAALLKKLDLPTGMSKNQMLTALNLLISRDEFVKLAKEND